MMQIERIALRFHNTRNSAIVLARPSSSSHCVTYQTFQKLVISAMPLPEMISPCANVRRSCNLLMRDESDVERKGPRSITLNDNKLDDLAETIKHSIFNQKEDVSAVRETKKDYFETMEFSAWDSESWHYTGCSYSRPGLSKEQESWQRNERVALYIMVLDCINFCFWPDNDMGTNSKRNLLEYEHLAEALKRLAEQDDIVDGTSTTFSDDPTSTDKAEAPCSERTYAFSPVNLMTLTKEVFLEMVTKNLPTVCTDNASTYVIPNAEERSRLLVEMASGLVLFHGGSATEFISKAHRSADSLVNLIIQYFPGFRDTAIDGYGGRWVGFYKRAQIMVADLWAALGDGKQRRSTSATDNYNTLDHCCFQDIEVITTFADYRVPQLLRDLGVLDYSASLANKVDAGEVLTPFCADELYIRAGTVVAVDELVKLVKLKLDDSILADSCNAVTIDWYLWNIGEKMDRDGVLRQHHKVRTIYY